MKKLNQPGQILRNIKRKRIVRAENYRFSLKGFSISPRCFSSIYITKKAGTQSGQEAKIPQKLSTLRQSKKLLTWV